MFDEALEQLKSGEMTAKQVDLIVRQNPEMFLPSIRKKNIRKFKEGSRIRTIEELLEAEYIWWYGKPLHQSIVLSWQFRFVMTQLSRGTLKRADFTEEWIAKTMKEVNQILQQQGKESKNDRIEG